jgi:tetratricopeptide (TPR) repeat protein
MTPARRYEFRVYEQLGELYIKQERTKDAADTFGAVRARNPLHAQAPQLQARVIEIYERAASPRWRSTRRRNTSRYGVTSEFRRPTPKAGSGAAAGQDAPGRAGALLSRERAEEQGQRRLPGGGALVPRLPRVVPERPEAAQNNFLLAELLFEDGRFAEAGVEYEKAAYGYPVHEKSADAGYAALLSYARAMKKAPAGRGACRCSAPASPAHCVSPRPSPTDPRAGRC